MLWIFFVEDGLEVSVVMMRSMAGVCLSATMTWFCHRIAVELLCQIDARTDVVN
jgi:hypothetical protein